MWLSCKASNLTTEQAPPLPQIIPLYRLMTCRNRFFFFLPSISPLALQSLWTDGVPVIINNLGKTYYGVEARVEREKVKE